jgi:hypothetical protein
MAAEEVTFSGTLKKWTLTAVSDIHEFEDDMVVLKLNTTVQQYPNNPDATQQARIQVDIPDRPTAPIIAYLSDIVIMQGDNLASLEQMTAAAYAIRYP